jgi:chromosome segregation ATPase
MTFSKYIFCRFALFFGYSRKNTRLVNAASETHLLKEAEAFLGKSVWNNVEHIDQLSMEYWNLRKLIKEREEVASQLEVSEKLLAASYQERADMLGNSIEPYQDLLEQRQIIVAKIEAFARERDIIVAKARDIHKNYNGLKTKQEVLQKEDEQNEQLTNVHTRLAELKESFSVLKQKRQEIAEKIEQGDSQIQEIEKQIQERRKERTQSASSAFQHIGEANQKIAVLRAELGVVDTQMRQLYSEIGRFLSRNAHAHPACMKACSSQKSLIEIIAALRKSILYNNTLSELS